MNRLLLAAFGAIVVTASPAAARQVQPPVVPLPPGVNINQQARIERLSENHWKLVGDVEWAQDNFKISADELEFFTDTNTLTAKGNVSLTTATERISAESLDFNLTTKLGAFHKASGSSLIEDNPRKPKSQFGAQEVEVLFYGELIEKIGYRKYRITKGGFTTCVQANPRWIITSNSVVVNVNHYAMLKNAVMKVKGVPILYLPVVYYPINKDDRATGFLLPMYGTSSLRGQTLSNAFFWAFNRSQDATFMVDWFSKTGYGFGTEYRRVASEGSSTFARFYRLHEKPLSFANPVDGTTVTAPGRQSFQVQASVVQSLPLNLKARARVDYFSSVSIQQTYNTDVLAATANVRFFGGGVSGNWGSYGASATFDRSETFFNSTQSTVAGAAPRFSVSRKEQPLFGTPIYFSVGGEYASLVRETVVTNADGTRTASDTGLGRFDASPRIRIPFTRWPFFTVNASLAWRFTRWNQSLDPVSGAQVLTPITRSYFDMSARFVGPVLNRVWNTPRSRYAEKIKHTIEPWFGIQRLTAIDNYNQLVKVDGIDQIIGGSTSIQYGLRNRLYAKRMQDGVAGQATQIFGLNVQQTYYTDARASQFDPAYVSSLYVPVVKPQKLSPISVDATLSPTDTLSASFRTEYNTYASTFVSFSAAGTLRLSDWLSTTTSWNKRNFGPGGVGLASINHYLNQDTSVSFNKNRIGAHLSFNWDLGNNKFLQRKITGFYNAQCCGVILEYQTFDFSGLFLAGYSLRAVKDHRFSVGVTLAGIGTFSNIFGALGGGTTR